MTDVLDQIREQLKEQLKGKYDLNEKVNVEWWLSTIDTEGEDALFKLNKDGDYAAVTYKQFMQDALKGKTELTRSEIYDLAFNPDRFTKIIKDHTYYSKEDQVKK